jgi:hypothetical protein
VARHAALDKQHNFPVAGCLSVLKRQSADQSTDWQYLFVSDPLNRCLFTLSPKEGNRSAFGHVLLFLNFENPAIQSLMIKKVLHKVNTVPHKFKEVGQGLLIIEASRSHFSDTPHSVGLLWTSDQPDAQTSTLYHTTFTRDRHPCPRRDSNQQTQQANSRRSTL